MVKKRTNKNRSIIRSAKDAIILITIGFILGFTTLFMYQKYHPSNTQVSYDIYSLAYDKEQDILKTGIFEHNTGTCDFDCRAKNLTPGHYYENLYKGNTCSLKYAMSMWTASPTHNKILDSQYSQGIMLITTKDGVCYITLDLKK